MVLEVTEKKGVDIGVVKGAAHYLAEENPEGFVEGLLGFIQKHP